MKKIIKIGFLLTIFSGSAMAIGQPVSDINNTAELKKIESLQVEQNRLLRQILNELKSSRKEKLQEQKDMTIQTFTTSDKKQ